MPAPATDVTGDFTVTLTVPAAGAGRLAAAGRGGHHRESRRDLGDDLLHHPRAFASPCRLSSAAPGETISCHLGTNFSAYANVGTINVGRQNQAPTPNPLTDGTGNFSANVLVPALNPGAYTITVRTEDPNFTATAAISIVSATAGGVSPLRSPSRR